MRTTMNWTTKGVAALATGTTLFCGMGIVTAVALTSHPARPRPPRRRRPRQPPRPARLLTTAA
jgi:putative intracellular protease/amidase